MGEALRDAHGTLVDLDGAVLLGRGGEARVWGLPAAGRALKHLEPHARTPERLAGLRHMVERAPPRMIGSRDETPWGWPETLVYEGDACVGFTMRWFRKRRALFTVLCPTERMRLFPAFDHRYLHRVGANLARALATLHDARIVVGDLSESNVLVSSDATVALVDVDSFQFEDAGGTLHPCPVGRPELLPPEHHGACFASTPKTPESDAFSLAVLLFELLFDGPHPFSGVHRGGGSPPTLAEAIVAGDYVFAPHSALAPRFGMPGPEVVAPELLDAFARTFTEGLHRPELRTPPRAGAELLARAEGRLVRCAHVPAHRHPRDAPHCAWCARRSTYGRAFETFVTAPAVASEAIALPTLDAAAPTQHALPRLADDATPLPPSATPNPDSAQEPARLLAPIAPAVPRLSDESARQPTAAAPNRDPDPAQEPVPVRLLPPSAFAHRSPPRSSRKRQAHAPVPPHVPSKPIAEGPTPPFDTPVASARIPEFPARPPAPIAEVARSPNRAGPSSRAPTPHLGATGTSARPEVASGTEPPTARADTPPTRPPRRHDVPPATLPLSTLGLRHVAAAALLVGAALLGRCSAPSTPDGAGAARAPASSTPGIPPPSASPSGVRNSSVLRRDAPTAERTAPRAPR